MQEDDKKKLVSTKFIRNNVYLWDVQRLKKVSLEHKSTNYTYSKKNLEIKSYNIYFIILAKHIFLRKLFLCGESISRFFFFFSRKPLFENIHLKKKHFWRIWEKPLKTLLKRNILKKLWKTFLKTFFWLFYCFGLPPFLENRFFFLLKKSSFRKNNQKKQIYAS